MWNSKAVLQRLTAIADSLVDVDAAYRGWGANPSHRFVAFVLLAGSTAIGTPNATAGLLRRERRHHVVFAYRIDGNPDIAAAEDKLADTLDAFELAVYQDAPLKPW
jgi:hypothetical protein